LVEAANGGTLFLDEIGDLSQEHQGKILRFLNDGSFRPVGSNDLMKSDVRIISATNRNLTEKINERTFREDLFHRLNQYTIETEPLSKRPEDVIVLTNRLFTSRPDAKAKFLIYSYDWPGNVRELEELDGCDFEDTSELLLKSIAERLGADYGELAKLSFDDVMGFTFERITQIKKKDNASEEPHGVNKAISFLEAAALAKEKLPFGNIVKAYEIALLKGLGGLSHQEIARIIHVRPQALSQPSEYLTKFLAKMAPSHVPKGLRLIPDFELLFLTHTPEYEEARRQLNKLEALPEPTRTPYQST
jgi:hypothetical protein